MFHLFGCLVVVCVFLHYFTKKGTGGNVGAMGATGAVVAPLVTGYWIGTRAIDTAASDVVLTAGTLSDTSSTGWSMSSFSVVAQSGIASGVYHVEYSCTARITTTGSMSSRIKYNGVVLSDNQLIISDPANSGTLTGNLHVHWLLDVVAGTTISPFVSRATCTTCTNANHIMTINRIS